MAEWAPQALSLALLAPRQALSRSERGNRSESGENCTPFADNRVKKKLFDETDE
jgi:hypothetical protein